MSEIKHKTKKELQDELNIRNEEYNSLTKRFNHYKSIVNVNKTLASRLGLSNSITNSHNGARAYDTIFGYPANPTFEDYIESYERGDIASRIIDAPVSAVWSSQPKVVEKDKAEERDNQFNTAWNKVCKRTNLFHYIRRADKLNRLGRFSVLYLGFSGTSSLDRPVPKNSELVFVRPFGENSVTIAEFDANIYSPRFGKPLYYNINTNEPNATGVAKGSDFTKTIKVHYSRVIHITEDNLISEIYSIPALQKVYNRLIDVTKVVGGSAEMFWRGARPGYTAIAESDAKFTEEDVEQMESQLEDFDNDLTRWLQLQGVNVKSLDMQIYTPKEHFNVLTACIASAVGIPQRILIGAESGELASSMDERNWNNRILERRKDFAEPNIITPLVTRLQELGQLPVVDFEIIWDDLATLTEKDKAEVAYKNSIACFNFFNSETALSVVGPEIFARSIMQFSEEEVEEIVSNYKKYEKERKEFKKAELDKLQSENEPNVAGDKDADSK
jgi:hypothetical protein